MYQQKLMGACINKCGYSTNSYIYIYILYIYTILPQSSNKLGMYCIYAAISSTATYYYTKSTSSCPLWKIVRSSCFTAMFYHGHPVGVHPFIHPPPRRRLYSVTYVASVGSVQDNRPPSSAASKSCRVVAWLGRNGRFAHGLMNGRVFSWCSLSEGFCQPPKKRPTTDLYGL